MTPSSLRLFNVQLLFLIFYLLPLPEAHKNPANGVCTSKFIRNKVASFEVITGCRVIEGNLHISLIDEAKPEEYHNYTFPELREVTGYLILTQVAGLQTLRYLFPNLAVVRGQELVHNYALLIFQMSDMQEVGLPALTNLPGRGAWISGNPNLCYVDTIDWASITNDSKVNNIQKNKPSDQCPNKCPNGCPKAESDNRDLCWSNEDCQIVHKLTCPARCNGRPCTADGQECCHEQCLGGCTGPSSSDCFVCKKLEIKDNSPDGRGFICRSSCPPSTYEYMSRRCVTEDECHNITSWNSKQLELRGKPVDNYNGRDVCVLECPKNYASGVRQDGVAYCKPCDGPCKKVCNTVLVDSVAASVALKGCTRILGQLKIQIRGYSANLVKELENNLDMIEEIDDSLIVANSHSLVSLNFLKSLKKIHGKKLEEDLYALVVKSNENIQELWNTTSHNVTITKPEARVLFHYNPKLCVNKIWDFVKTSGISQKKDDRIDIGTSNGDKVPCDQKKLELQILSRTNSSVLIRWENFRRNLTEARHLLNYEVHYRISPERNASIYEDRDPCGGDYWKIIDVPKMIFNGSIEQEPKWQEEKLITGLKYYTQYALYVKTVVILNTEVDSPNNNTAAQSDIEYFTTLPGVPSPPREMTLVSNSSRGIVLSWFPPESPNGKIERYQVYIRTEFEDSEFQDQRDYCKAGRPEPSKSSLGSREITTAPSITQFLPKNGSDEKECCACSANSNQDNVPIKSLAERQSAALLEQQVQDAIYNIIYIPRVTPDDNIKDNEIDSSVENTSNSFSVRKRRQATENDSSLTADNSKEQDVRKFPSELVPQAEHFPMTHVGLHLVQEVWANETSLDGRKKTIFVLNNLTHFTRYTIGIMACRNISPYIDNDTRICSDMVRESVRTLPNEAADIVNVSSIHVNVSGNSVKLRWDEPLEPNGITMAYKINITKVDTAKSSEPPHVVCVTRKAFNESGRNYTFPKLLHPGNYSIRIQVISLALFEANYTAAKYFQVDASDTGMNTGQVVAVVLPIVFLIVVGILFFLYCVRTRRLVKQITSANPEYLQNVDIPEEWEVSRDKIELLGELGKGSFGMVYKGTIKDYRGQGKVKCAIKAVAPGAPSEDRYRFLQEALIMTQMDCYHVIKLLGVVSLTQPTYVIMELMTMGDLKKYLRQRRPDTPYSTGEPPPTIKQILRMAAGIADGMAYLDSKGFVHRDLAARNCMVAEDLSVKVGDFGMTKDTDYYRKSTRGLLPVRWMAPESIKDGIFTIQSDLWSFGVVLWEMATLAAQPYQGLSNDQVFHYVRDGNIMERPENCPDRLYEMMIRCWQYRPTDRPTFSDILEWLVPEVEPSFAQISFYHSPMGLKYRADVLARPAADDHQYVTSKTPLRATFDEDLSESDAGESSGSEEDRALNHVEDHDDVDNARYRRCNGTGTLCSASDLSTAFPLPNPAGSANSPPNPIGRNQNNNNRPTRDFITLDLNQFNTSNNSRNPAADTSTNNLIRRSPASSPPGPGGLSSPESVPPSGTAPRKGLGSIVHTPEGGGGFKLPNGIGLPSRLKSESSHISGSSPTPAVNGFVVNNMKLNPVKETTKTTQF